ncbi:MAG TPA: oligosaccharide flippase family protein [Nitriliruptorales bacterium]|nr:oligosaccharide flippase family protein [Nitriliruptorales bacterium]
MGTTTFTVGAALRSGVVRTVGGSLTTFLLLPLILDRLEASVYGAWATLATLLAIGSLADVGVRTEIVRRASEAHARGNRSAAAAAVREGTTLVAALAAIVAAAAILAAPRIVAWVFGTGGTAGTDEGQLALLLRALAALLAVSLVLDTYLSGLAALQRLDYRNYGQTAGLLLATLVVVASLLAGWGIWSLLAGACVERLTTVAVEWYGMSRLLPEATFRPARLRWASAGAFLALSGTALLTQISDIVDFQWDKLVIAHYVGPAAVAQYEVGTTLTMQVRNIAIFPLGLLLAGVAGAAVAGLQRARHVHDRIARPVVAVAAVALSAVVVFGPPAVRLWLGDDFEPAGYVSRILAVAMSINLISAASTYVAFARKHHAIPATSAAINVVVNGVGSLLLTRRLGLLGAVYGSVLGNAAGLLTAVWLLGRLSPPRGVFVRPVATAAVLAAVGIAVGLPEASTTWISLISRTAAYGAVVTGVLTVTGDLRPREIVRAIRAR